MVEPQLAMTDSRVDLEQQHELHELLTRFEEQTLFSRGPEDIDEVLADLHVEHSIKTGSAQTVSSKPYQHSHLRNCG